MSSICCRVRRVRRERVPKSITGACRNYHPIPCSNRSPRCFAAGPFAPRECRQRIAHVGSLTTEREENAVMKPPITVLIPCKNEVHHIAACIASAKPIADEILIADSGSTDGTLELVRSLGDYRIIEREYVHSADFKNWAIPQAKNDWILVLDADERLTPELREEILTLFADGSPPQDGYRVRFAPYFLGRPIRHCGWNTTTSIRLFRRSVGRYSTRRVHADVIVESGKVGMLHHKIEHYTCTSLERWMEKRNRYTERGAEELFAAGRKVS
ncbi:MAG: glycosyltransferase family 2 protein, partial [Planctomycetota bacterium]